MTKEPEITAQPVDVDALYLEERPGLVRLAFLLTGSSETAEDVVQDAFERCLPRLDGVNKPGAYLRTAVVNGARSKVRRERSAPVLPRPMAVELGESALELWAALRTLSERRRTAVVLRYWVDLPVTEIADAVPVSERPSADTNVVPLAEADGGMRLRPMVAVAGVVGAAAALLIGLLIWQNDDDGPAENVATQDPPCPRRLRPRPRRRPRSRRSRR